MEIIVSGSPCVHRPRCDLINHKGSKEKQTTDWIHQKKKKSLYFTITEWIPKMLPNRVHGSKCGQIKIPWQFREVHYKT